MNAEDQVEHAENNHFSINEQRQLLYSCLLRYAPDMGRLRDRVLDRAVLVGLVGSSESAPLKVGEIQRNLRFANELRPETIRQALERLLARGAVNATTIRKKNAYFLDGETARKIDEESRAGRDLFDRVLRKRLRDVEYLVNSVTGATVLRRFLFECFARFGRQIANNVTGRATTDDLVERPDVHHAFEAAAAGANLSAQARASLLARCRSLLASKDPDDEALKFQLAQGFYVAELLDVEGVRFNPLADEAFAGAVFYLDTNVLLMYFIGNEDHVALFDEMLRVAGRIGIRLRVTRATVNEVRRVAADHLANVGQVLDVVPNEILEARVRDDFLAAFQTERAKEPDLTVQEFGHRFDELTTTLEVHGIELDDRTEDEMIGRHDRVRVEVAIQKGAEISRGWGKSGPILEHDVAHYYAVMGARAGEGRVWFLTRDRGLILAAVELARDEFPFCFSIAGFLQSLSPFSESPSEQRSLADAFSVIVAEQIVPAEPIFDLAEVNLLARQHEDIFLTPADKVLEALDAIKTQVLQGRSLLSVEKDLLSLEIRKRLASSDLDMRRAAEEQCALAEAEKALQAAEAEQAHQRQLEAERVAAKLVVDNEALVRDREVLLADKTALQVSGAESSKVIESDRVRLLEEAQHRRLERSLAGIVVGVLLAVFAPALSDWLGRSNPSLESWKTIITLGVRYLGAMIALVAPVAYILHRHWPGELKVLTYTAAVTTALVLLDPFPESMLAPFAKYASTAAVVAAILLGVLHARRPGPDEPK